MILGFDTETTGKAAKRATFMDMYNPRLVQLSAALFDQSGKMHHAIKLMVKPQGFEIPEEASGIHGITTEHALRYGLPLLTVLGLFDELVVIADELVAFNKQYDELIMESECYHNDVSPPFPENKIILCAMLGSKDIVKLKGQFGDYKWPKLQEAYKHFFGEEFDGAHDSFADLKATVKVHLAVEQWHREQTKPAKKP